MQKFVARNFHEKQIASLVAGEHLFLPAFRGHVVEIPSAKTAAERKMGVVSSGGIEIFRRKKALVAPLRALDAQCDA